MKWDKEVNRIVMECWVRSEPGVRGYRQRMKRIWDERGVFEASEQRLADQARAIRTNEWLTAAEIEEIRRKVEIGVVENRRVEEENHEGGEDDGGVGETVAGQPEEIDEEEWQEEGDGQVIGKDGGDRGTGDPLSMGAPMSEGAIGGTPRDAEGEASQRSKGTGTQEGYNWNVRRCEELSEEQKHIVDRIKDMLNNPDQLEQVNLRAVDRKKVREKTKSVNKVLACLETENISITNRVLVAVGNVVAELVGRKNKKANTQEPKWKRRILGKISNLRKDLSNVVEWGKNKLNNKLTQERLERKYHVRNKGIKSVAEELKQRIKANTAKINKYEERNNQFVQNRLFKTNQKRLYEKIEGIERNHEIVPDAEESKAFWSNIWGRPIQHNEQAEWITSVEEQVKGVKQQDNFVITKESMKKQMGKIPNWKASGPDNLVGFWLKSFTNLHQHIIEQLNDVIRSGEIPKWMTIGRTILALKDETKGNLVSNFRPITCLPIMWKLLTGLMAEEVYTHLDDQNLLPDEQKGCRRNSRGTKDQLMIDKMVLKNCKDRCTNLCLGWIDYKKAYDMLPHSWIIKCLEIFKIADNIKETIKKSMKEWKVQLTSAGKELGEVSVRRGIFQGDSLSPILFVMALIPLSIILNNSKIGYRLGQNRGKINHLLFMDDLKLYGRSRNELDSLVQTVRVVSEDIGMEFGIEKCALIEMCRGKMVRSEGIELPNGETIKALEEDEGYKYLGVIQCDRIKSKEMKDMISKEYFRRTRKILKSSLNAGNIIKAINARAVSIIRYGAGIVFWTRAELEEMDRKTRKLLTIYRCLHPQADVDRLYWKRSDGGRGLQSVEDVVRTEEISLEWYVKSKEERLLKEVGKQKIFKRSDELKEVNEERQLAYKKLQDPKKTKDEIVEARKKAYEGKKLHSALDRECREIRDNNDSWVWLKKGYMKKETEGLILAAQDQAIRTKWIKKHIDKTEQSAMCRMCGEREETVAHVVSECKQLAQNEYKKVRHDKVAAILHWHMCKQYGFAYTEKSYEHFVEKGMRVLENEDVKVLWDFPIQTDAKLDHNRPDIVLIDKKKKICFLIDVACPFDTRIEKKEREKIEAYTDLKYEILKCWKGEVKKVIIVPVIIGALGMVTKKLAKFLEQINFAPGIEPLQKACLLGTARIIRKVLDCQ